MTLFKQYTKTLVKESQEVKPQKTSEPLTEAKSKYVYSAQDIYKKADSALNPKESGIHAEVTETTEGDKVDIEAIFVDEEGQRVSLPDELYHKLIQEFKWGNSELTAGDLDVNKRYIKYSYDKITHGNEDYSLENDEQALKYLTYTTVKQYIANGILKGDINNPADIAYWSDRLFKSNMKNVAKLSVDDVVKLDKNSPVIEELLRKGRISPKLLQKLPITSNNRVDVAKFVGNLRNEILQLVNNYEDPESAGSLMLNYLPVNWDDKKKIDWSKARICKYLSSIIPPHPWRVRLRKSPDDESINYLNDGKLWYLFRTEQDAFDALQRETEGWRDGEDYRTNSEIFHEDGDLCPEIKQLLDLINERYTKQWIGEEITLDDFLHFYPKEYELDKSAYVYDIDGMIQTNQDLSNYLNNNILPKIKETSNEVKKSFAQAFNSEKNRTMKNSGPSRELNQDRKYDFYSKVD